MQSRRLVTDNRDLHSRASRSLFLEHSVAELAYLVRRHEVSAAELTRHALDQIAAFDGELNAFIQIDADQAVAIARGIDKSLARREAIGPLAGIPLAVKDTERVAGYRTTCGSAAWHDALPSLTTSALASRLIEAGCVVIGKTNVPEFAIRPTTDNPAYGSTRNPWALDYSCGGSSGGSVAAVAAGMVPLATGSDGGGSIRIPSAVCGVSGFKPTPGRVPSADVDPPTWPNLSTNGVIARTAADIGFATQVARGPYALDLRSLPDDGQDWDAAAREPMLPRRILWSPSLGYTQVDSEILDICSRAIALLKAAGCEVVEASGVFHQDPGLTLATFVGNFTLRTVEEFRNTDRWPLLDPLSILTAEFARRTTNGLTVIRALDACHVLNHDLVEAMKGFDVLVCPTTRGQAPHAEQRHPVEGLLHLLETSSPFFQTLDKTQSAHLMAGLAQEIAWADDVSLPLGLVDGAEVLDFSCMTAGFNLTASPAGTVCAGLTRAGLPVGLQVIGPRLGDAEVLGAMRAFESLFPPVGVPAALLSRTDET